MSLSRRGFCRLTALGSIFLAGSADAGLMKSLLFEPAAEVDLDMGRLLTQASSPRYANEIWVLIDKQEMRLRVFRGNALLESFSSIAVGRGGSSAQRFEGGRTTPLGEFHVTRFNPESRFDFFIGLDYPTPFHARQALETGVYSQQDYDDYFAYYRINGTPPQQTVLGGYIGIHGVGEADAEIHRRMDWTDGCVALEDHQIARLSSIVDIGTRVVIR